jgi:hypothetical protein
VAAGLGPALRTAIRADRSLGEMLPTSAVCAMTGESTAKDNCISECEKSRQLINLGRNSERAERTHRRPRKRDEQTHRCLRKRDERTHRGLWIRDDQPTLSALSRMLSSRCLRTTGKVHEQVTPQRVAGVDARTATPPDPRLPRRGLAGCRQLDPSHPASFCYLRTCSS